MLWSVFNKHFSFQPGRGYIYLLKSHLLWSVINDEIWRFSDSEVFTKTWIKMVSDLFTRSNSTNFFRLKYISRKHAQFLRAARGFGWGGGGAKFWKTLYMSAYRHNSYPFPIIFFLVCYFGGISYCWIIFKISISLSW